MSTLSNQSQSHTLRPTLQQAGWKQRDHTPAKQRWQREAQFSISTGFHPGFLGLLDQHLASIHHAQTQYKRRVRVHLLFSYVAGEHQVAQAKTTIRQYPDLNISLYVVKDRLTCGQARNWLQLKMHTPWKVFFDVDVALSPDYFSNLHSTLAGIARDYPTVRSIGGGIGCWGETRIGLCEYLMDMHAYYGKTYSNWRHIHAADFKRCISRPRSSSHHASVYTKKSVTYLQGFNHIIHQDVFDRVTYDGNFFGAEDREMAANIIRLGFRIMLVPECMVYHYYNFTFRDILRRKYGHGYYTAMFRKKHRQSGLYVSGLRKWLGYTLSVLFPPKTFRNLQGYWYYLISYLSYAAGTCMYHLQDRLQQFNVFRFNYSAYSFTTASEDQDEE